MGEIIVFWLIWKFGGWSLGVLVQVLSSWYFSVSIADILAGHILVFQLQKINYCHTKMTLYMLTKINWIPMHLFNYIHLLL